MSIQTQIERIDGLKDRIGTKLSELGLVEPSPNLEASTEAIEKISDNGAVSGNISQVAQQYSVPAGYHNGNGKVQIASAEQSKIIPENIKSGITVLGVIGNYAGEGVKLQTKTATPTKSQQQITPDEGYDGLSSVTVEPIPANYADVTPVTATQENVLATKIFVDSSGAKKTGTMADNGAVQATIDGLTSESYTVPAGFHNGSGSVSLTSAIEDALAAI